MGQKTVELGSLMVPHLPPLHTSNLPALATDPKDAIGTRRRANSLLHAF